MQQLTHRVLHWATIQPNKMAIDDGINTLCYQELADKAKSLALRLKRAGVTSGDRIVILLPKGNDAIIAILGTLLLNATYVPVDTGSPRARLQSILDDSDAKALIVNNNTESWFKNIPSVNISTTVIFNEFKPVDTYLSTDAYILYTSGFTGIPNGVCISHTAMYSFFTAVNCHMGISRHSRCMNTSALYFDVSIADVLLPLYQGASVWLGPNIPLPFRYLDIISSNCITHFCAVGSTLTMLTTTPQFNNNNWEHLSCIMTGAEVLNPNSISKWLAVSPNAVIINGYGPTETTCVCTVFEITKDIFDDYSEFPIGNALPNISIMINRKGDNENDFGELCIAGPQVMNSYLNRDNLNQSRLFIDDGVKYYRTGDKVRYDKEGNLIFLGRIDEQIKVNGYRVHLGEVAAPFRNIKGIQEVIAVKIEHFQYGECLAVIVKTEDLALDLASLKNQCVKELPIYMRPLLIAKIDNLPLSASGKVNTKLVRSLATKHYQDVSSHESIIKCCNEEFNFE